MPPTACADLEDVIGNGSSAERSTEPQVELGLPGGQPLAAAAFSAATPASSCAEPRCSILRDPRRVDHTICTAVAPEDVLTVRT